VYEVDRKEFAKALEFYFLAAELNYNKAIEAIGKMYEKGRGVPVHYHVALEWYIKAAKHNSPHSYILIGSMFLNGLGVKTDIVKAQEWFHKQKLSVQNDEFRIVLSKKQKSKIQGNGEMSDTHLIHHA
jgi:TPR repeat protein